MKITKPLVLIAVSAKSATKQEIETPKSDIPQKIITTSTTPIPNPTLSPEILSYVEKEPDSQEVHYVKISRDGLSKENSLLSLGLNGFLFVVLSGASLKIVALKIANNRISKHINYLKKEIKLYERLVDDTLKLNSNDDIDLLKQHIARNLLFRSSTNELTEILGSPSIV